MSLLIECALTVAVLIALGFPLRATLRRLGVPPAVSLMALGLLLGPDLLNLVPREYSSVCATPLAKMAFAVLLVRAGFGLAPGALRAILVPSLAFGIVPVAAEIAVALGGARLILFEDVRLCLLLAFLLAAVSPAVVLPVMLEQKDLGRGGVRYVPDRIMGQTVINAFVAQTGILFTLGLLVPDSLAKSVIVPADWPWSVSLVVAVILGIGTATLLGWLVPLQPLLTQASAVTVVVALLGVAVYFGTSRLGLESVFATLALGITLRRRFPSSEPVLRVGLRRVWAVAEILLFVNLGLRIPLSAILDAYLLSIVLMILVVGVGLRVGVAFLLTRVTRLDRKESVYVSIAQIPKATIQAVFGAIPLQRFSEAGLVALIPAGEVLLVAAAVAICATAPVGAVALDRWASRLLCNEPQS